MIFPPDNRKHVKWHSILATNVGGAGWIIMPDGFSYHTGLTSVSASSNIYLNCYSNWYAHWTYIIAFSGRRLRHMAPRPCGWGPWSSINAVRPFEWTIVLAALAYRPGLKDLNESQTWKIIIVDSSSEAQLESWTLGASLIIGERCVVQRRSDSAESFSQ